MAEAFHLDRNAVATLLRGRQGAIALDLLRRGARIESQAKLNATGRDYGDGTRGPRVQTGRLRASIAHGLGIDELGLYVDVGTNVPYGRYLEEGTDRMRPYPFLKPALIAGLY